MTARPLVALAIAAMLTAAQAREKYEGNLVDHRFYAEKDYRDLIYEDLSEISVGKDTSVGSRCTQAGCGATTSFYWRPRLQCANDSPLIAGGWRGGEAVPKAPAQDGCITVPTDRCLEDSTATKPP